MNTNVMFSSATDLWATPQDFFDKLNAEFHFTLDPCACPDNGMCLPLSNSPSRRPRKGCGIKRSKHFARIAQFTQYKQVMGEIAPIAVH